MTNIILCGGNGTRLWPLSRTLLPKQFLKLFEGKSLFQKTLIRNQKVCDSLFIVSQAEQYFLAVEQIEDLTLQDHKVQYLLEPVGRNTAPAIALACFALDKDELVLVTPSDHLIKDEKAYWAAIKKVKILAKKNKLVTFGITPEFPETGFGYIEAAGENVLSFKEKPDIVTAKSYLDAGNYYWNSGMFCFKAGIFLDELKKYSPDIYKASKKAFENKVPITNKQLQIKHEFMRRIPAKSIDYAVMEMSDKVKVVHSNIGWSDLGSFESLDKEIKSSENIINVGSNNNLILSYKKVASIDIENLIIIDTKDALLIAKKGSSQKIKEVVNKLKEQGSELTNIHTKAYRPWGSYTILHESEGYKVKQILINPGKRLSLQKHQHRAEHWTFVHGTGRVTIGSMEFIVKTNESKYLPKGAIHRLENIGKTPLVMIEVQIGDYLGEDDIIRIEDDFKRVKTP